MANDTVCTLTKRGQVSIPASLRKKMGLSAGQKLRWEPVSESKVQLSVEPASGADFAKALGFARKRLLRKPRRTAEWMREIRAGE